MNYNHTFEQVSYEGLEVTAEATLTIEFKGEGEDVEPEAIDIDITHLDVDETIINSSKNEHTNLDKFLMETFNNELSEWGELRNDVIMRSHEESRNDTLI